jgi:hypothetical protein
LGAEFLTVRNWQKQGFTISFSPITGRVFIRLSGGADMVVQGLPDLSAAADSTEGASLEMEGIEVFMFASTSGGVFFGRRRTAGSERGNVEWSGELLPEFLPPLSVEKYASLTFQVDKLREKAQISITWAGQTLPIWAPLPASQHTFGSV